MGLVSFLSFSTPMITLLMILLYIGRHKKYTGWLRIESKYFGRWLNMFKKCFLSGTKALQKKHSKVVFFF